VSNVSKSIATEQIFSGLTVHVPPTWEYAENSTDLFGTLTPQLVFGTLTPQFVFGILNM
jgi:hypothetical protein